MNRNESRVDAASTAKPRANPRQCSIRKREPRASSSDFSKWVVSKKPVTHKLLWKERAQAKVRSVF
jgi:hypothetical protein